jgi:glycosyltransferase involved in cell wall biosynthesis
LLVPFRRGPQSKSAAVFEKPVEIICRFIDKRPFRETPAPPNCSPDDLGSSDWPTICAGVRNAQTSPRFLLPTRSKVIRERLSMSTPPITVLLPVYNAAPYLTAAVESILTQTCRDIELLAIDDGSTDASLSILESLAARDRRIRVVARENKGLVATLNQGLDLANGALIARMDADDIAYPDRLETQAAAFQEEPELCLTGMDVDCLYGRRIKRTAARDVTPREIMITNIFHGFFIHPTVMLNNVILKRAGLRYDPRYPDNEDFDLWRRITPAHPVRFINRKALAWRQSSDSVRMRRFVEAIRVHHRIVDEQLSRHGIIENCRIFGSVVDCTDRVSPGELAILTDALQTIWAFDGFAGEERSAYEEGFSFLISHLISALELHNEIGEIVPWLMRTGFSRHIRFKDLFTSLLSRVAGDRAAHLSATMLQRANIYLRSFPIASRIPLPAPVSRSL